MCRWHQSFAVIGAALVNTLALSQTSPVWWTLPASPTSNRHEDIFFVTPALGWVVSGSSRQIHRTTNGGISWQLQFQSSSTLRCVGFADSLHGWAGVLNPSPYLYETTNSGATWQGVTGIPEPLPSGVCGISVVNSSIVYASGKYNGPARVIKTTDGGTTWISMNMDSVASTLIDCYFFSPDSGFVVGGVGSYPSLIRAVVLFTSDGGMTWHRRHIGSHTSEWGWKLSFPTRQVGYVSLERNSGPTFFLKTTDGGTSWVEKPFLPTYYDEEGIGFVTPELGWIGGWNQSIYQTSDGGESWSPLNIAGNVNRFRFFGDTLGYAAGVRVFKYSRDTSTVSVLSTTLQMPTEFVLSQNFPNPFNPTTTFSFDLPKEGRIRIAVFDLLGREIATVADGHFETGHHTATFEAGNLAAGVYLYVLTGERFTSTKKMVLIK